MDEIKCSSNKNTSVERTLRSSKRKDIVDSMCKLYNVMQQLQSMQLDGKDHTDLVSSSPLESDKSETYSDVQYKLFDTQLKYMRKVLQRESKRRLKNGPEPQQRNIMGEYIEQQNNLSSIEEDNNAADLDTIPIKLEKETQTAKFSSSLDNSEDSPCSIVVDIEKPEQGKEGVKPSQFKIPHQPPKQQPKYSQVSHYHLNLSDIPFFVGTSTTASHSVIANVQNIVGLMKEHNKGLCGSTITRKPSKSVEMQEVKRLRSALKVLSIELSNLALEHEKLRDHLDAKPVEKTKDETFKQYEELTELMKSKAEQIVQFNDQILKLRANVKQLNLPKKQMQKSKTRLRSRTCSSNNSLAPAASNRHLMVSLKQLKKRFQNDDVVWAPLNKT